ncbi:MAG: OmpW family protein [Betaproteobacteria bacterium]|nr:OmpW family protein [Betaproteobacteria bacterium]
MKKIIAVSLAASSLIFAAGAHAEAGDIVVRLRATNVDPDVSSKLGQKTDQAYGAGTAAALYGNANANLQVDDNLIPEVDFSYYFTKNLAAELILATGTRHDVKTSGTGPLLTSRNLGSVDLLPPTLTLQWHFMPDQTFDPYLGAGATYVYSLDKNLKAQSVIGPQKIKIDNDMWGGALQAGFDINLKDRWLLNFDVKKLWVGTDVKLNLAGTGWKKIDSLDIDPWVISIGFGKKF